MRFAPRIEETTTIPYRTKGEDEKIERLDTTTTTTPQQQPRWQPPPRPQAPRLHELNKVRNIQNLTVQNWPFKKSQNFFILKIIGASDCHQYHEDGSSWWRARRGPDVPKGRWSLGCGREFSRILALCCPYGVSRLWQGQGCLIATFSLHVFYQPYQQQSRPDSLQFLGPYARDRRSNYLWRLSLHLWWEKYCRFHRQVWQPQW